MESNISQKLTGLICLIILTLTFSLANAFGQTDQARIVGTVSDSLGAVVPNATIIVHNEKTGEERTFTTNGQGYFIVSGLKPSFYTIKISNAGFADFEQKHVQLSVGQELNFNPQLQPEGATAIVNVVTSESTINTASASLSANVNQREVENLPVNGRQLSQLYLQAPGAVNSGSGTFGDIRFSGRAVEQNVVRYDGVEGTGIIDASPGNLNGEVPSPFRLQSSLENVQEFRVDSSNFPAEYGTGTGGQINVVTKSGGNEFHGSIFEYLRRDSFDARNFFDNITPGIPKSDLTLDQFGGSIGGPIIKDKFFFFFSYEGYRVRSGLNFVEAVPSALARSRAVASIQPYLDAFKSPDAVIISGASTNPDFDIAQLQAQAKTDEDSYALRLDHRLNQSNNLYFRFFRDNGTDDRPEGVSGRRVLISAQPQNGVFGWQSIIGSNKVNEFKIGYNGARTRINGVAPTVNGLDLSSVIINISGSVANTGIAGQGSSSGISIPGGLVRANSATNGRGQPYTPYSLSFIDSLNWTKGNHNIKFGGEFRRIRLYTDRLGGTTYTFSNLNAFLSNSPQSIQYLGDVSAASPFNNGLTGERLAQQEYYIGYGQDEWKIRPGLTLSYGLRYEYYTPLRERNNGQVLFDSDTGTLKPSDSAAFKSSKTNFGPRVAMTYSPNINNTVGFFSGGKTVFRGGFGIYYGPGQTEDQIQPIESDRISSTISGSTIFNGQQLLAFPANTQAIIDNFNANPNNRQYQPRAYSNEYEIPERIYQYTFSWQQELPYNLVSTIAYVGSQGRNLFLRSVTNKILPGSTSILNGTNLPTGVGVINRTNAAGQIIGVTTVRQFDIISGTTQQRPFAEIDYKTSGGDDSYNALQMSLARRFDTGLTLNAQYTFGKSEGTTAGSNEARTSAQFENFEADRGANNFDVRHTFNLSALYDLPIGRGRYFDAGKIGNFLVGGWEIGGILNARSGLPIEVLVVRPDTVAVCQASAGCQIGATTVAQGFTATLGTNPSSSVPLPIGFTVVQNVPGGGASRNVRRPNLTGAPLYLDNDRNFINPAAFSIPVAGEFGDLSRNALRGPNFRQFDLVLSKRFKIREKMNFEFRTEVFNIFNFTNFANPSATLNNALPTLSVASGGNAYTLSGGLQPGEEFTQSRAGSTFGLLRSTVERTVGLGTNRQIQFALRFNF